jgi:hypothetical protein
LAFVPKLTVTFLGGPAKISIIWSPLSSIFWVLGSSYLVMRAAPCELGPIGVTGQAGKRRAPQASRNCVLFGKGVVLGKLAVHGRVVQVKNGIVVGLPGVVPFVVAKPAMGLVTE